MGKQLDYCGMRARLDGLYEAVWDGIVFFVNWDEARVYQHFVASHGQPARTTSGVNEAITRV